MPMNKGYCDDCGDKLSKKELKAKTDNCFPCQKGNRDE